MTDEKSPVSTVELSYPLVSALHARGPRFTGGRPVIRVIGGSKQSDADTVITSGITRSQSVARSDTGTMIEFGESPTLSTHHEKSTLVNGDGFATVHRSYKRDEWVLYGSSVGSLATRTFS